MSIQHGSPSTEVDSASTGGTAGLGRSGNGVGSPPKSPITPPSKTDEAGRPRAVDAPEQSPRAAETGARKSLFSIGHTIKPTVVMDFSRQLSSFLQAGIPVLESLEIVGEQTSSKLMRAVITDIGSAIRRGTGFAEAVDNHPEVFPPYYRAMLSAAEFTGDLDVVLGQLASYLERDIEARRQVKSALTYPILVLIIAVIAMFAMSVLVLPKFTSLYASLGANLPLPTRMLMGFTDFMSAWWLAILGVMALIAVALLAVVGGARGKARRDVTVTKMPVIGHLFQLVSLERFCRVLSSLTLAGVPLPAAIGLSADSTNNTMFQKRMVPVRDALVRGSGLYEPMVASGLFPIAARQMIQVGERTGLLGDQLGKAASYYERELSYSMKKATELFQPFVIIFVALIVGFVAVAQIAAMYSIFGQVK